MGNWGWVVAWPVTAGTGVNGLTKEVFNGLAFDTKGRGRDDYQNCTSSVIYVKTWEAVNILHVLES